MEKQYFKNLLEDLYTIYNPGNLAYVDDLVERYSRLEFDAVRNIFIKYNRRDAAYYDENIGTDEHIIKLIKDYEGGSRILQMANLKEQGLKKNIDKKDEIKEIAEKKIEELQKGTKVEIDERVKTIQEKIGETETQLKELYLKKAADIEKIVQQFEDKLKQLDENQQKVENDCIIRIFSTHTNSELNLPNKKIISGLAKGTRLIVYDENKKIIGLEISDVTCDMVSDKERKPIIEVFVNKV